MTKEQLRKFIKDTRGLVRGASAEKKIHLLKLIKEAKRRCEETQLNQISLDNKKVEETLNSKFATAALAGAAGATVSDSGDNIQNSDYLEEK